MKNSMSTIEQFTVNERVYGHFLIKTATTETDRRGKKYMDIRLMDKTGEIPGKLWGSEPVHTDTLTEYEIVYATGTVTEFNGEKQLKLEYIEVMNDDMPMENFVPSAPMTTEELSEEVFGFIGGIQDESIHKLVHTIVSERQNDFFEYPAARRMHHAVRGGLAYHVITMLRSAKALMDVYPFLRADYLYASIILHDIEKISEMEAKHGMASGYSRSGSLLGHIVQGTILVEKVAEQIGMDQDKKETLQHLILSHHEKGEWGSPQPPKTPEAVMLHFIDNIDAKMYMMEEAINASGQETETKKIPGLGYRSLFL